MCGIAGLVDFRTRAPSAEVLKAMCVALGRRGPDDHGHLIKGPCGLAHTRLSIIDVAHSIQPMTTADQAVALSFNGEIYNYLQLRQELAEAGHSFSTNGDTEVLLHLVAEHWEKAPARLDAMFAFAAWDERGQRLLLARDPMGEKPLYYSTPAPGLLVFGSEQKALLTHPEVDGGIDEDALRQALRFRAVYGKGCLRGGIRQLGPGEYLEFDKTGVRIGRFFDLAAETATEKRAQSGRTDEQLVQDGLALFMESVEERLLADVPVGAFLSGGLDSSLVVAAMRRVRGKGAPLATYSVGFSGDAHSELPFAAMVAEAIETDHTPIVVGPESFVRRMTELAICRDGPVSEPADVAVAEMSRIARRDVKVVLSGEGADEVFAGYPKYGLANAPAPLKAAVRLIGADRTAGLAGLAGLDSRRAKVAARALAAGDEISEIVQWFSALDRSQLTQLLPGLGWSDAAWRGTMAYQEELLNQMPKASRLARMQTVDCLTWLPGNMLERGDRMTMAEGLEMRPPFLDKRLAAFGLALPDRLKVRGRIGKWMPKQWAQDLLPAEIINRKKWGFRVPLAQWFRNELRDMLNDSLSAPSGICATYGDREAIRRLVESHQSGEVDASGALWSLFTAEIWYQTAKVRTLAQAAAASVA
jgi:asparagine synthase (glutamine-hydrolysing)